MDFSKLAIKGRSSQGNIFSRNPIHKILLKSKGTSTLAGHQIWYDEDVNKLNDIGHGTLLGEFQGDDKIIVFTAKDQYYTTGYDVGHHFPEDTIKVEKYNPSKVYSVVYWDEAASYYYVKRFMAEDTERMLSFVDEENSGSKSVAISDEVRPALEVIYGGVHATKPTDIIDVADFIGVKGYKAKGKRVTTYIVEKLRFIPQHFNPAPDEPMGNEPQAESEEPSEELSGNLGSIGAQRVEEATAVAAESAAEQEEIEHNEPEEELNEVQEQSDEEELRGPVELEIIVPMDEDERGHHIDSTQLNLF